MKRLLALLFLLITPAAYGQVDYTNAISLPEAVLNPALNGCAPGVPTCGAWKEGGGWVTGDFQNGVYIFSYQNSALFQDIDLSPFKTNATQFFFSFDLNNSCRNSIGGFCENLFGPIDYIRVKAYAFDINDSLIGEATFMNGNISTANCFLLCESRWERFGYFTSFESQTELSRIRIEFVGGDAGFWGGYYGPLIDNVSAGLRYISDQNWTRLSGEYEQFTLAEDTVVRYGADGVYTSLLLSAGTYSCGNGLFGDPIGGVVKSCEIIEPESTAVNCALDPYNPECIINTLGIDDGTVDYSDPQQVLASLENNTTNTGADDGIDDGSDDGSSDGSEFVEEEEEVLVAEEEAAEEEISLEEMLQEEAVADEQEVLVAEETEEVASEPVSAPVVALVDDSKASELADSISKNVLEGALAIAADATAAATTGSAATTVTQNDSSSRSSSTQAAAVATVTTESSTIETKVEEEKTEAMVVSDVGSETLELGRQIGREALAATASQSEQSATESVAQAESIAISSSETQSMMAVSTDTTQTTVTEDVAIAATNKIEEVDDGKREVQQVVFEDSSTSSISEIEQQIVAQSESAVEADSSVVTSDNTSEQIFEDKTEIVAAAETSTTEQTDTFAEIMQLDIKPVTEETEDKDVEFIQQLAAASNEQKQEEINNSGFSEEEKITIANDPALANAFNLAPNVTNLEVAGVLNNKQEEKSDAEKRADEVVAANAKEQEEINKNYMDADQSGIVAAMGADTDVGAYRTAMIQDNNIWYKPEDIYKNVVIKDNVRGSYFLEKGNTDTYKKMVEEQYK